MFRGVDPGAWDVGRARLPPLLDHHRLPDPARHRLRHGGRARRSGRHRRPRAGHRGDRLLRRRRDQPGRRERVVHLRQLLQRAGRLLLPEQPVGDLRADRAAVADPALPAGARLRLPRRTGRRQRRARRARGHRGRPGAGPLRQRADADRGLHLPDGRAHHLRRPDQVPVGRRARALAAEGPDRAGTRLSDPPRRRRRRLLRRGRRRGRRAGDRPARRLPGSARAEHDRGLRLGLRRADALSGRAAGRVRRVRRLLRRGRAAQPAPARGAH